MQRFKSRKLSSFGAKAALFVQRGGVTANCFRPLLVFILFTLTLAVLPTVGEEESDASGSPEGRGLDSQRIFIGSFRIVGSSALPRDKVDRAVYPFLGPDRTLDDIEKARLALQKVYHDEGFKTVTVEVPQQLGNRGVIALKVNENRVGRLTVTGSRFFDIEKIRRRAKSLHEGMLPDFNAVQKDLMALNQWPDRRITPAINPGAIEGTVDVELQVEDTFPLHGSFEYNNRYSPNTSEGRISATARYDNLWQLGHSAGFAAQIAPENIDDSEVYTAFYVARIPGFDLFNFFLQGTTQRSNISTLGGSAVVGEGETYGFRLLFNLPGKTGFYHSASLGLDYKDLKQSLSFQTETVNTPVRYWPITASYTGVLSGTSFETSLDASVTFSARSWGSSLEEFDNRRFNADAGFLYFRGDLSHKQNLPLDLQLFGELQGQASNRPLLDSEQFSLGGLGTVRGYLESSAVGDNAITTTLELRSPNLLAWTGKRQECRVFCFLDWGYAQIKDPLPEQAASFRLWSYGVGARLRLLDFLNSEVVFGIPQTDIEPNEKGDSLLTFRVWAEI